MHDLSQTHDVSPSLFDAPPPLSYMQAREFVRWCCSFGVNFRNSPDITNLRYWAKKNKISIDEGDELDILETARPLFLKRVEQAVRKAERAERSDPTN